MNTTRKEKHTPGPWILSKKGNEPRMVKIGTGPDGWLGVAAAFGDTDDEAKANARLIAAAPDLLQFVRDFYNGALTADLVAEAKSLIARAEGE